MLHVEAYPRLSTELDHLNNSVGHQVDQKTTLETECGYPPSAQEGPPGCKQARPLPEQAAAGAG